MSLPSYRGDIINGPEFTAEARIPDPKRLVQAYNQSAATMNLLRAFTTGGYAGLDRVSKWNLDFMVNTPKGARYQEIAARVDESLQFMKVRILTSNCQYTAISCCVQAYVCWPDTCEPHECTLNTQFHMMQACGIDQSQVDMKETELYTSHECLLLDYEQALTRLDSTSGLWYDCSAHFVWCGERTRQPENSHVEFLRGVANPIGVKVSNKSSPEGLVSLCKLLNPDNTPGRLGIIIRMGANNVRQSLPNLIAAVQEHGLTVTWICDPVHGNTETVNGFKTRRYNKIQDEVEAFFDVHEQMGSVPGGVHLERTGDNVTECIGGVLPAHALR